MTHELKVTGRILQISEATRRRNPELFGAGEVRAAQLQPDQGRTLDGGAPKKTASRGRLARGGPVLRVTLISCRRRAIADDDNDRTGYKELRDCIARFFGLDDERGTIAWEYGQHETRGEQETLVRIEVI